MNDPLDKIKKLLRMQRGGTAGEIDNALRMARQIADKHNIDLDSIDASEDSALTTLTHKAVRVSKSISYDERYACSIVVRFFHVEAVFRQHYDMALFEQITDLELIGTAVDIGIAEYVFGFLLAHFKTCWRRRNKRLKNRAAFINGLANGIHSKLRETNEVTVRMGSKQEALVISIRAYVALLFPKTTEMKSRKATPLNGAAAAAGYGMGRQTNIRQPLNGAPSATGPLLLK